MTWTSAWERESRYSAELDQPCPYLAARNPSCLDLADVFVEVSSELEVEAVALVAVFHEYSRVDTRIRRNLVELDPWVPSGVQ